MSIQLMLSSTYNLNAFLSHYLQESCFHLGHSGKNQDFKLVPRTDGIKKPHIIFKYLILKMVGLTNKSSNFVFSHREHILLRLHVLIVCYLSYNFTHVLYQSFLLLSPVTISQLLFFSFSQLLLTVLNPSSSLMVSFPNSWLLILFCDPGHLSDHRIWTIHHNILGLMKDTHWRQYLIPFLNLAVTMRDSVP